MLRILGVNRITQQQIYYQWQQRNKGIWRGDDNTYVSATLLSGEISDIYKYEIYTIFNFRALGICIKDFILNLAMTVKNVAIDVTFATKNSEMSLLVKLTELDRTGVLLACLFVERVRSYEPSVSRNLKQVFVEFLKKLWLSDFAPSFVGCDKDKSQMNGFQGV